MNIFVAYEKTGNAGRGNFIGCFVKEKDAQKAIIGRGFWGSDGEYDEVKLHESYEDYSNNK